MLLRIPDCLVLTLAILWKTVFTTTLNRKYIGQQEEIHEDVTQAQHTNSFANDLMIQQTDHHP